MRYPGLKKILDLIGKNPTDLVLRERFLILVFELPDEEKSTWMKALATILYAVDPHEALKLAHMIYQYDPDRMQISFLAECLDALGREDAANELRVQIQARAADPEPLVRESVSAGLIEHGGIELKQSFDQPQERSLEPPVDVSNVDLEKTSVKDELKNQEAEQVSFKLPIPENIELSSGAFNEANEEKTEILSAQDDDAVTDNIPSKGEDNSEKDGYIPFKLSGDSRHSDGADDSGLASTASPLDPLSDVVSPIDHLAGAVSSFASRSGKDKTNSNDPWASQSITSYEPVNLELENIPPLEKPSSVEVPEGSPYEFPLEGAPTQILAVPKSEGELESVNLTSDSADSSDAGQGYVEEKSSQDVSIKEPGGYSFSSVLEFQGAMQSLLVGLTIEDLKDFNNENDQHNFDWGHELYSDLLHFLTNDEEDMHIDDFVFGFFGLHHSKRLANLLDESGLWGVDASYFGLYLDSLLAAGAARRALVMIQYQTSKDSSDEWLAACQRRLPQIWQQLGVQGPLQVENIPREEFFTVLNKRHLPSWKSVLSF